MAYGDDDLIPVLLAAAAAADSLERPTRPGIEAHITEAAAAEQMTHQRVRVSAVRCPGGAARKRSPATVPRWPSPGWREKLPRS